MLPDIVRSTLADPAGLQALIGAASVLAVALVTGWLGRGKFKRELLWDKRQAACNDILSRLYSSAVIGDAISVGFDDDPHTFYAGEHLESLHGEYAGKISSAHQVFQDNYLLLPPAFRRRYEQLVQERNEAWHYSSGPDAYLDQIAANERARRDLMDLARAELGISPWWSRMGLRLRPAFSRLSTNSRNQWRRLRRVNTPHDF